MIENIETVRTAVFVSILLYNVYKMETKLKIIGKIYEGCSKAIAI